MQRRHWWWLGLAAVWIISLGLRVAFFRGIDVEDTIRADARSYQLLAWNLANRGVYSEAARPPFEPHLRWPPGYPLLLAPFHAGQELLLGTEAALRVQVVAGSCLPLLVILVGCRIMPPAAAWLAGLLSACAPVLVTTPAFLVSETYFTLLLFVMVLIFLRLLARPTVPLALAAGMLSGILALVRMSAALLPAVLAWHLARRAVGPARRRAAVVLVIGAAALIVPWQVRTHLAIARGAASYSYLADALAMSLHPNLVHGNSYRGYGYLADPEYPEYSESIASVLRELWERTAADPWPNLRWQLMGKWLTLLEFDMIQSRPVHIYPVEHGLFRPARMAPSGQDEPLAWFYRLFRFLYYCAILPAVMIGAVRTVRARRAPATPASLTVETLSLVLAYNVLVHGLIFPLPRFMLPMRPVLDLLALAAPFHDEQGAHRAAAHGAVSTGAQSSSTSRHDVSRRLSKPRAPGSRV